MPNPQARDIERRAGEGIDQLRKGVEEAAQNVLGDEAESMRLARQQLDELLKQANGEAARAATRPRMKIPLALAAGIAVIAIGGLLWSARSGSMAATRGIPTGVSIALPAEGSVLRSVELAWHPVAGAFMYHVEVLEEDGTLRWQRATRDTTATVPGDSLATGKTYVWWVRAELTTAGERRSELRRFTFKTP